MASKGITADDILSVGAPPSAIAAHGQASPAATRGGGQTPPDGKGPRPITMDELLMQREANATTTVQTDRLRRAQQLRDMGLVDPRVDGNPDVPIEGFMRTTRAPVEPAKAANFGAALKAGVIADPQAQRREIAASLFPDDPSGVSRVGMLDDVPVYVDDEGKLRRVSPRSVRFGASVLANTPEIAGSLIGSLATGNPVTGSAVGTSGGRAFKRGVSELLFSEPASPASLGREMAGEAATDVMGGVIGKGVAKFADRGRIADFTPANYREAETVRDRLKRATGIDLDLAQASGNPKLIAIRAYAARYPGRSSEMIAAADEAARGQLDTAVNRTLDMIAKATPAEVAGANGINAAKLVIETAKKARDKAVEPYYAAARKVTLSGDLVETLQRDPVLRTMAAKVTKSPLYQRDLGIDPKATTTAAGGRRFASEETWVPGKGFQSKARVQMVGDLEVAPDLKSRSVGFWHAVRMELDDQISRNANEPNKVRILTQARKDLTAKLEAASPEYREANAYYAQKTREAIEPLEASAVGVLSRVTSPKAATAAARLFSDPNITAAEIRATRASISQQSPEAWDGLVRQWMAQQWNRALKESVTGEAVNPAGKLRQALIGTPEQRSKLNSAIGPGAADALSDLMEASLSLARTPIAGSNTMRDTEIKEQLKGTALTAFRWLTSPRQAALAAGEQRALERGTEAITEALLNPQKRAQLRQVVRMAPSTRKATILGSILGAKAVRGLVTNEDDDVPQPYASK